MDGHLRVDPPFPFPHYFTALGSADGAHGTVVFHQCRFTALRDEGHALFVAHWMEASADTSVPLEIDWPLFELAEENGAEVCIAARWGNVLIGYAVYIVHRHLHYRDHIVAEADAFYVHPYHRTGWVGVRLFEVAEEVLAQRGVHEIHQRVKRHVRTGRGRSDVGPVFRYLGYRPTETVYRKRIA